MKTLFKIGYVWPIFLYHLAAFSLGVVGLGFYFARKISALPPKGAIAGVALLPVAVVYIGAFGILCLVSLLVWIVVAYRKKKK